MNLQELLKEWAAEEPDRCQPKPKSIVPPSSIPFVVSVDEAAVDCNSATVQVAVQQAIEAHGWVWDVKRQIDGSKYSATARGYFGKSEASPAEALLSAYLEALRQTKTKEAA